MAPQPMAVKRGRCLDRLQGRTAKAAGKSSAALKVVTDQGHHHQRPGNDDDPCAWRRGGSQRVGCLGDHHQQDKKARCRERKISADQLPKVHWVDARGSQIQFQIVSDAQPLRHKLGVPMDAIGNGSLPSLHAWQRLVATRRRFGDIQVGEKDVRREVARRGFALAEPRSAAMACGGWGEFAGSRRFQRESKRFRAAVAVRETVIP